ncbi:MAG: AtpZ/AtpI family protein [bacterium]|nr:AtpZ/AtpI family protein [bacterium]
MDPKIYLYLLMKLGGVMSGSILLFFFIGLNVDKFIGNKGIGIMVGVIIGVAGGFLFLFKELGRLSELETKTSDNQDDERETETLK